MTAVFLREGNLSLDSRALKELSVIAEHTDVEIVGMTDVNQENNIYTYNGKEFSSNNCRSSYSSKIGHIMSLVKYYFFVYRWISKNKNQIEFIYAVNMWLGLVAFFAKKRFDLPYIYDIYDSLPYTRSYPKFIKKIMIYIETKVINMANSTIIVSDERVKQIRKSNPQKLNIIYNSPELTDDVVKMNNENSTGLFRIVYVGGLAPYRAIPELLEAVSKMNELELIIGGDGSLKDLVKKYDRNFSNIHYIGIQKYEDVLKLESTADMLTALYDPIIPNHKYASPNKFFEGFALGKPLLMFENTGMDNWISLNNAGSVITEVSSKAIQQGILDIMTKFGRDDKLLRLRMQEIYDNQFSWKLMIEKLNILINDLELDNKK